MEYAELGPFRVSRFCLGGGPFGVHGYGKVDLGELRKVFDQAIAAGINFIDLADTYGLGHAESFVGSLVGKRRHKLIIATKFGVRRDASGKTFYDSSVEWLEQALADSLQRLRSDYVDLFQIHYLSGENPLSSLVERLERKREQGVIRSYGLSNISLSDLTGLCAAPPGLVSFQNEFSLALRAREDDIRSLVSKFGFAFLSHSCLGQGILTGKYSLASSFESDDRRSRNVYVNFHGERMARNLKIVERLREHAQPLTKTPTQVALRWILDFMPATALIVGCKNREQLDDCCGAFGWTLPRRVVESLDSASRSNLSSSENFVECSGLNRSHDSG